MSIAHRSERRYGPGTEHPAGRRGRRRRGGRRRRRRRSGTPGQACGGDRRHPRRDRRRVGVQRRGLRPLLRAEGRPVTSQAKADNWPVSAVPAAYMRPGSGSFTEFLTVAEPQLLPGRRPAADLSSALPHGTTIVAVSCAEGVVMAGDRRATMGNLIAQRDIEKVFVADSHSAIGSAGTAGVAVEMVRLFRLELEHYEKIEGVRLSLDGKANRLATMIRGNLGMAMQGLAVVPLFAGLEDAAAFGADPAVSAAGSQAPGRIFSYDVAGGKYEERDYFAVGSGSMFAR